MYDDGQLGNTPMLLGEYGNGSSQTLGRSEYLWLPLDDGTSQPIGLYTNSRLYAIHADPLNTPRQITDDTNKVVWQLPYSAFGDNKPTGVLAQVGAARLKATVPEVTFNLRFPGQYFDEESNLSYNYFRSYQPTQGRYAQSDPIGLAGGWSRFGNANQNALMYTDPLGLEVLLCSQPAFGWMPLGHQWLKTDTAEGRMGGTRGNVPGNQYGDLPGDPVQVTDHSGRSKQPGTTCSRVEGVDEKTVNDLIKPGRPLGRWGPTNQCQSFVRDVLGVARRSSSGSVTGR